MPQRLLTFMSRGHRDWRRVALAVMTAIAVALSSGGAVGADPRPTGPADPDRDPAATLGVIATADLPLVDGGDGSIRFPGAEGGTVRLLAKGPAWASTIFVAAPARGWRVADSVSARSASYSFRPGAAPLTVTVRFEDPGGIGVTDITRTLIVGAAAQAAHDPASPVVLDWVEDMSARIVDRRLRIETAFPDARVGCRDWQTVDEREVAVIDPEVEAVPANASFIDPAPEDLLESGLPSRDPDPEAASMRTISWASFAARWSARLRIAEEHRPTVILGGEVVRTSAVSSTFAHGQLTIPIATEGCHRFSLQLVDAAGRITTSAWPSVAPGRLSLGGRIVPRFSGGRFDLYRADAFVSQGTYTWCIGATSQMMVGLITGQRADPTSQRYLMSYAKTHDRVDDRQYGGSDDQGARAVLSRFAGAVYERIWVADTEELMRTAALRIRLTGAPAEVTVMDGHHAWVIHGFDAPRDPLLDGGASVEAVYVSGPLWPRPAQAGGFDPAPDTRLTRRQLARYLSPSGIHGPWKLLVPVPGILEQAAPLPHSLAEVGLTGWPPNLYASRAVLDSRVGPPVIDPDQPTNLAPAQTPTPTPTPTVSPGPLPTDSPAPSASTEPTASPTADPTAGPTGDPTAAPTPAPTADPTPDPTPDPTTDPTPDPTTGSTPP